MASSWMPWHAQPVPQDDPLTKGARTPRREPPSRPPPRSINWTRIARIALLAFALLAVNYWAAGRVTKEAPRVRIPYSPFFLDQIKAGNVAAITSRGTAVQGMFARALRYPPADPNARSTRRFQTEIPAFADENGLARLLQQKGVVINAESLEHAQPLWLSL